MDVNKKVIYGIDLAILVGTLLVLLFVVGYARPLAIAPLDDEITSNTSVLFAFEKGDVVLIDDNFDFTSPQKIYVKDSLIIRLEPGVYYWKVEGALSSSIRKLTIQSVLDLKVKEADKGDYVLVNAGNTLLDVEVYNNEILNKTLILEVDESKNVSGTAFVGREHA